MRNEKDPALQEFYNGLFADLANIDSTDGPLKGLPRELMEALKKEVITSEE
jgi:hypothetical protein